MKYKNRAAFLRPCQLVEKIEFAREAGFCNPFFAPGFPGQKTLLSAQVCGLSATPTNRARRADVRRKSHFSDFFDGLTGPHFCDPVILSEYYLLLNEGVLGRIQHALGLVESDVLDTEVTEQVEQELSVVAERYRAVVRITLLN